eukprot:g4628.t1
MHDTLDYRDWDGGSVGGKPSWLDPSCLPKPSSFRCESCGEALTFLLQIYAPLDDIAASAAPLTGPAAAVQLPMFDIVIENEAQVREDAGLDADLDTAAGSGVGGGGGGGGGLVAGGLDGADRQLQQDAGEEGKQDDEEARLRKKYLGEIGEGQPQSDESRGEDITEEDCKEAMRALRGTDVIEEEDEVLNAFQERVAVAKDQVLRYARWPSDTDAARGVLWTATKQKAAAGDIPACPHCGGERAFEFQVTPQMLHYLGMVGGEEQGQQGQQGQQEQQQQQDMSWGTLAVFTCRGSCGGEPTEDFGAYQWGRKGKRKPGQHISKEMVRRILEPFGTIRALFLNSSNTRAFATMANSAAAEAVVTTLHGRFFDEVLDDSPAHLKRRRLFASFSDKSADVAQQRATVVPDSVKVIDGPQPGLPSAKVLLDFLSPHEEAALLALFDDGRPWQRGIKRRVQHYGVEFDYVRRHVGKYVVAPVRGGAKIFRFGFDRCEALQRS